MRALVPPLAWIGARARWVLVVGAFAGLAFPDGAAFLRPALPAFVAMVYALAMLRIDPVEVARGFAEPRRLLPATALVLAMIVAMPVIAFWIARALDLGGAFETALVYTFAAPPIASAAAMCLIVGFNARTALELTVLASLLIPLTGPFVAEATLGAELEIDPLTLGLRMAAMIGGGFLMAILGRAALGTDWIDANRSALDGLAAVGFLLFILPLFDGVRDAMIARPGLSLAFLCLSAAIILGTIFAALRLPGDRRRNGAVGAAWGTRSVAIYLAALPPDPVFALYVAIFQFPMAAIPLVFRGDLASKSDAMAPDRSD